MSHWNLEHDTKTVSETTSLERRSAARHRCNVRAHCRLFGKSREEAMFGIVQDVSSAGIRLTLEESFTKGTILELTVVRRNGEICSPHLIRVRRSTKQSHNTWMIGATFVKQRSQEELRKFLSWSDRYEAVARVHKPAEDANLGIDPFVHGSAKERRKASRRKGSAVSIQVVHAVPGTMPVEGWVVNRSCSGICVSLGRAFPKEAKLKVRPVKSGETGSWAQAVVKFCRPAGSRWLIGCEWQTQMPAAVLQLFG